MNTKERKIVQLTSCDVYGLAALCDDGTVWLKRYSFSDWSRTNNVPQPIGDDVIKLMMEWKIEKGEVK